MNKDLKLIKKPKFNVNLFAKQFKRKLKEVFLKYKDIMIYILIAFTILYTLAYFIKTKTNFYSENLTYRNLNVLEYDDIYHARKIYDTNQDYEKMVGTIIKHPFINVWGQLIASIENMIFNNDNHTDHYFHIVVLQILLNLVGVFYLYKILTEHLKLKSKWCFITLTIYEVATVTLLGTLIIDSFIVSATLLIMSYYYLAKQKIAVSCILGILTAGLCITNSVAFAIMAIFLLKDKKDIIRVGIICILGLLAIMICLPYNDYFFSNFFTEISNQVNDYAIEQDSVSLYLKKIFYFILSSPIFFLDINYIALEDFNYLKFELHSEVFVIIATGLFFICLFYNLVKNIKNRNMIAATSIVLYNLFLHAVIKFGLDDGTIYGLHYLFAEILMLSFGINIKNKILKTIFIGILLIILLTQIAYNMEGFLNMLILFKDWK